MTHTSVLALVLLAWTVAASGCQSSNGAPPATTAGASGSGGMGEAGAPSPTGGTGGASPGGSGGASSGGTGGVSPGGSGGITSGGSGGVAGASGGAGAGGAMNAAGANGDAGTDAGTPGAGGAGGAPAGFSLWVEAESGKMMNGATVAACAATCAPQALNDGASCCSGGKEVRNILGAAGRNCFGQPLTCGSGIVLTATVPADADYDVTWWFHCGNNDSFRDNTCGGMRYSAGTPGVCRPHEIVLDGVLQGDSATKAYYYQFPCWASSWSLIHPAVTTLPLKAGSNTIYIHAPTDYESATVDSGLDAVDLDVIHVTAAGTGTGTRVTPVAKAN